METEIKIEEKNTQHMLMEIRDDGMRRLLHFNPPTLDDVKSALDAFLDEKFRGFININITDKE